MFKTSKILGIFFLFLILFSGLTTGALRTIDSVNIEVSDTDVPVGESVTIEGEVEGTGITAIRIGHREKGETIWNTRDLEERIFLGKDCSNGCSISDTFSRDSSGTEEFQIKAEAGKLSENSLVRRVEFTRQEESTGSLEIHVEDNDGMNGKEMEDARVKLSDGVDRGPKYTNSDGDVVFNDLPANTDIDVQVKCYDETENKYNIEIDSGEQREIEINFDEKFDSSVCGEDIDEEPTARFSYSPDNPEVEEWVTFDASNSDGNIENYHWDFGDGDTYTDDDPKLRHRYNHEGEYEVELTVEEHDGDEDTKTKTVEVEDTDEDDSGDEDEPDDEKDGKARLNIFVEDEDGDSLDAEVVVDNGNWFSHDTGSDGEVSFEVQSGDVDITVSKEGYRTETRHVSLDAGEDEDVSFTLEERYSDFEPEDARLDVHVEDDEYDELEDAKVTVENGDHEVRYTDSDGEARFYLDSDSYDIEVECNNEEEHRSVYLSDGERESIDIRFDEDFDSDTCGEDVDEDRDHDTDDGDDGDEEGLEITDVRYPDSVCRGGSFSVDMRIQNYGGFHELVTITGSGLGSINTGQSFALDVAETKSATLRFTNVEGSGTEEFDIRATNHVSDETTETIEVRDCGFFPDTDNDYYYDADPTGVTAEVSPKETVVGSAVNVKGYVDGVRGRSQITISANGDRKATVSTEPDGYYSTYIRLDEVGDNIIRVRSGQAETSEVVTAVPTSTVSGITAPDKVFETESFKVCANVDSQVEPQVFLLKNNEVVDSKFGNGEVCFETKASEVGEHEYQVNTLTYGRQSSSTTETVNILELGNEITNFPDQIATVESESGMVKVELYNVHNDTKRYKVKLNGIRTSWLSQSQEDVILTKGERETVYFYVTPKEEGTFEPTITVVSEDTTIYSEEISVYAGGTKNPRKTSFFDRLVQIFSL